MLTPIKKPCSRTRRMQRREGCRQSKASRWCRSPFHCCCSCSYWIWRKKRSRQFSPPEVSRSSELRERDADLSTAGAYPQEVNVARPKQIPRHRDIRNEELYEPAGLMVRGLYKGFERGIGSERHYSSKDRLPNADGLSKEREAAVNMFGFNENKTLDSTVAHQSLRVQHFMWYGINQCRGRGGVADGH